MVGRKRLTTPLQERLMQNYLNAQTKQQKQEAFNALFACDYEFLNNLALKLEKEVGQDYFNDIVNIYSGTIRCYKPQCAASYLSMFALRYRYFYAYKHGISRNGEKVKKIQRTKPVTFSNAQELEKLLPQAYYDGESALIKGVLTEKLIGKLLEFCKPEELDIIIKYVCDEKGIKQIMEERNDYRSVACISFIKQRELRRAKKKFYSRKIKHDCNLYNELPHEPSYLTDIFVTEKSKDLEN